jgi:hypothetical protein
MTPDDRDRFLIALAKFLGENPKQPSPMEEVLVCEGWLLDELVREIIPRQGEFHLDREKFNRLMLNCGRRLSSSHFYDCYFKGVKTLDSFEQAVEKFREHAMWLYGNFAFGYKRIATSEKEEFELLIQTTQPIPSDVYQSRSDFRDIEQIPVADLSLLGYISSGELKDLDVSKKLVETLLEDPARIEDVLNRLGAERQGKLSKLLGTYGIAFPAAGTSGLSEAQLKEKAKQIADVYNPLIERQKNAVAAGKRNTHRYLTLPHLDVYVATSMRTHEDYVAQHEFIKLVFDDPQVASLKLRYFDPTLSYVDDRISKGLVEMLMLQRAAVTIYNAGAEDTLGKDSELATTLAQGKTVIVYVPSEPRIVTLDDGRQIDLDKRADTFQVGHPLGLQINIRTGVANGIIVVRSPKQCARMLRKVILRELSFAILHQDGNFLLEETETKSILRVVSDDPFLTHAFWTYFRHLTPEEN